MYQLFSPIQLPSSTYLYFCALCYVMHSFLLPSNINDGGKKLNIVLTDALIFFLINFEFECKEVRKSFQVIFSQLDSLGQFSNSSTKSGPGIKRHIILHYSCRLRKIQPVRMSVLNNELYETSTQVNRSSIKSIKDIDALDCTMYAPMSLSDSINLIMQFDPLWIV